MSRLISIPPLVGPPLLTSWSGWAGCRPARRCGSRWQAPCPAGTPPGPCCPWCGTPPAGPSRGKHSLPSPGKAPERERKRQRGDAQLKTNKQEQRATETGAKETRMCAERISTSSFTGSWIYDNSGLCVMKSFTLPFFGSEPCVLSKPTLPTLLVTAFTCLNQMNNIANPNVMFFLWTSQ